MGSKKYQVIVDGDWGSDEMQVAAVLADYQRNYPDNFEIVGATATFGNSPLADVVNNAAKILWFLGLPNLNIYAGAKTSKDGEVKESDEAHILFPADVNVPNDTSKIKNTEDLSAEDKAKYGNAAVKFIIETLRAGENEGVIITATGPLTNIRMAIEYAKTYEPEILDNLKEISIMGACVEAFHCEYDADGRPTGKKPQGNISKETEFNANQGPKDFQYVMESNLPISLFPMDCTHQVTLTNEGENPEEIAASYQDKGEPWNNPDIYQNRRQYRHPEATHGPDEMDREAQLRARLKDYPAAMSVVLDLMRGPAHLDALKYQTFPTIHDVHTAYRVLELVGITEPKYSYRDPKAVRVETNDPNTNEFTTSNGMTTLRDTEANERGIAIAQRILDPNALFHDIAERIAGCIQHRARQQGGKLVKLTEEEQRSMNSQQAATLANDNDRPDAHRDRA